MTTRNDPDAPGGPGEQVLLGQAASPGLAIGPLARLDPARPDPHAESAATGTEDGRERLSAAVAQARRELELLSADNAGDLGGEVLGFQIALLDDPELLEPAEPVLARGAGAQAAWEAAIGELIDLYARDEDEYFQARAEDLRDLRQRVLGALASGDAAATEVPQRAVVIAETLSPSCFLEIDWTQVRGAALIHGSATSHVAMLARARGVPLVTGLGEGLRDLPADVPAVLDAVDGRLIVDPSQQTRVAYDERLSERAAADEADRAYSARPATTADGTPVRVYVNVDDPAVLAASDPGICDGIGLTRTEFLFRDGPADEATQLAAYRRIMAWADGRPVTIRTLDAGGDKPVPGVTPAGESNPFLGQRGLRLSLARPDLFRTQLRALLRAAADGPLKILLPMVTLPRELAAAREMLADARRDLAAEGIDVPDTPLGIMVETPSAALRPFDFDADFYSIGTNDLVQYVMAAARDVDAVAQLQDARDSAVLELIARVAEAARQRGVECSVCGEAAGDAESIPCLLDAEVRALSVPPAAVGRTKRAVAGHRTRSGNGA